MVKLFSLPVAKIRADTSAQPRESMDETYAQDLAEILRKQADSLPPIVVFYDGRSYFLADGFHRLRAHVIARLKAILAEVRQGTQRDAILYSCGANASHGLRRTNEDKRRAVRTLLLDDEWSGWSNRAISEKCVVSDWLVRELREELNMPVQETVTFNRMGKTLTVANRKSSGTPQAREKDSIARRQAETVAAELERIGRSLNRMAQELIELQPQQSVWSFPILGEKIAGAWKFQRNEAKKAA